jgi:hypothetical protein
MATVALHGHVISLTPESTPLAPRSFISLRINNLPAFTGAPITACFDFYPTSACPTLGDFCYGYNYLVRTYVSSPAASPT